MNRAKLDNWGSLQCQNLFLELAWHESTCMNLVNSLSNGAGLNVLTRFWSLQITKIMWFQPQVAIRTWSKHLYLLNSKHRRNLMFISSCDSFSCAKTQNTKTKPAHANMSWNHAKMSFRFGTANVCGFLSEFQLKYCWFGMKFLVNWVNIKLMESSILC